MWDFLQQLLNDSTGRYAPYITWKDKETGVFKIVDPAGLAKLWGIQKNHLSMNYDKTEIEVVAPLSTQSRALRKNLLVVIFNVQSDEQYKGIITGKNFAKGENRITL